MNFKTYFSREVIKEDFKDRPNEWVHYTDLPFLSFNPKQFHSDPMGYYFFPIDYSPNNYWTTRKYKFFVTISPKSKILDFSNMTEKQKREIAKKAEVNPDTVKEDGKINLDWLYDAIRSKFSSKVSASFNKFFRELGYDALFDDKRIIHCCEEQLVVLNPKIIESRRMEMPKKNAFQGMTDFIKLLKDKGEEYGDVKVDPIKKHKDEVSTHMTITKNPKNYATIKIYYDTQTLSNNEIKASLLYSQPRLNYGSGAEYNVIDGERRKISSSDKSMSNLDYSITTFTNFTLKKIFNPAPPVKESVDDDIAKQQKNANYHVGEGDSNKFYGNTGAGVLIKAESTGRYLLGLRSIHVNEPNTWGIFGGKIEDNEDPVNAVKREVREEIGYTGKMFLKPVFIFKKGSFTFHNFLGIVPDEFVPDLDWENSDAQWFNLDKLPHNLHFGVKELLKQTKGKL